MTSNNTNQLNSTFERFMYWMDSEMCTCYTTSNCYMHLLYNFKLWIHKTLNQWINNLVWQG